MKEYIERQWLIDWFTIKGKDAEIINEVGQVPLPTIRENIKDAPAADVVEVVRCKDCKYYAAMITDTASGNMETAPWGICTQPWFNSDEYDVQENGYCSYGERKMDKEE